jgi:hypothetical protein
MTADNVYVDATRSALIGRRARAPRAGTSIREHIWATALLGGFVLVYLWPALIQGRVLSDDSFLYLLSPWNVNTPPGLSHFMNPLLSDAAQYLYPWDVYVRHAVRGGTLPTWNPFVLSGTPFYTNSQNGLTGLFNLPLWLLPLNYALGVVAWLKLWVAATGSYLLARQLRLGFWPGVLAGVCFGLCSFNVLWLEHQTLPASAVWLPWTVLAVERLLHRRGLADVIWLALASALIIDGGHPGTEVQALGAAALYAVVRAGTMEGAPAERLRGLAYAAGGMVLGALLMAFVIVPVVKAGSGTEGEVTRAGGGYILPRSALRTIFFPEWWGRPSEGNYAGPINYVERTMYAGVIGVLMAALALCLRSDWRRKLPFLVIGVVGPATAVGVPVIHWIVVHLPGFSSVQEARMIFWAPFGIAMLAAFGLQAIIDRPRGLERRAWLVVGAGVAVALIALVGLDPSLHAIRTTINHFRTGTEYHLAEVLALTAIGWWLIFTAALAAVVWVWRSGRLSPRTVAIVLVVLAAADMYHFAHGFQPMGPLPQAIPRGTPAIAYLQRNSGQSRVIGLNDAGGVYSTLPADANINYGLREPTGQDPPQPTLRYFHLWQLAAPDQNDVFGLTLPTLTPVALRVMSVLGVRYIFTDPAAAPLAGLPAVYRGSDLIIYRNAGAVAPAFVPPVVQPVAGERSALSAISSATFDPQRVALVEPGPSGSVPRAGAGVVSIQREQGSSVRMSANMTRGGLVVLNDAWAQGWSAAIDGRPAQILRVNDVMRGVDVPAGQHTITWSYSVPGLRLGTVVSLLALLLVMAAGGWLLIRRRRAGAAPYPRSLATSPNDIADSAKPSERFSAHNAGSR